jgi:hypothetical protein
MTAKGDCSSRPTVQRGSAWLGTGGDAGMAGDYDAGVGLQRKAGPSASLGMTIEASFPPRED